MTDQRGWIWAEDAYAQSKMLDHSGWNGKLPRKITPSDIDIAYDNFGRIVFCELSRFYSDWRELKPGQRMLYENVIKGGAHCACLCRHSVAAPVQIATRTDFDSFQVMLWDYGLVYSAVQPGTYWETFLLNWFASRDAPLFVRRKILGRNAANGGGQL